MKYILTPDLEYPDQFDTTHDKLECHCCHKTILKVLLHIINIIPTPLLLIHNVEQ